MCHFPDLLACQRIHGHRRVMVGGVNHAIGDQREGLGAVAVAHGIGPLGHKPLDVALGDSGQWAVALALGPHAIDEHIARAVLVLVQVGGGLSGCAANGRERKGARQIDGR